MKFVIITFFLFFSITSGFSSSTVDTSKWNAFLNENYIGGADQFLNYAYKSIRYPRNAIEACRVGKVYVHVEIDTNGVVSKIQFENKLGLGIESAIEQIFDPIIANWTKSDHLRRGEFSIGFLIGENMSEINGDIILTAYVDQGCTLPVSLKIK